MGAHRVIGEVDVLLQEGVHIRFAPIPRRGAGVFEHAAHDAVGAFAVLLDLLKIQLAGPKEWARSQPARSPSSWSFMSAITSSISSINSTETSEKLVTKLSGILDFMGDAGRKLAE